MTNLIIKLTNFTKIYKSDHLTVTALSNIDLEIKKGEFVAIMGPSGSGKSTLLNLIGCLDKPSSGSYFLESDNINQKNQRALALTRRRKIGFVFQSFNLLPRISVIKNIELPLIYTKVKKIEREKRTKEALIKVGLEKRINFKPSQLSGGEIQRVAIARAIITNPAVILADEPTGNLDSKSGIKIMKIFKKLNQEGATIILVTHEKHIAAYAKRIINLKDGKITKNITSQK